MRTEYYINNCIRTLFILVILLAFTPEPIFGQTFTFINQPTILDTLYSANPPKDTFKFKINEYDFVVTQGCEILKINDGKIICATLIDFGFMYQIHKMAYLIHDNRIYFLFFIHENGKDYAALYSFKSKNLKGLKRIHFINCFELKSSFLNGDNLELEFTNKTYNINLKRGLKNENTNHVVE